MPRVIAHQQSFDSLNIAQFFELFFADGNTLYSPSARTETGWITEQVEPFLVRRRLCFYTIANTALHPQPFRCVETQRCWFAPGQDDGAGQQALIIETDIKPEIATTLFAIAAEWTVTNITAGGCQLVVNGSVACQGSFWGLGGYAEDLLTKQTTEMFEAWLTAARHLLASPRSPEPPLSSAHRSGSSSSSSSVFAASSSEQARNRLRSRNRSVSPPTNSEDPVTQIQGIWCRLEPPAPSFGSLPDYVWTALDFRDDAHDDGHEVHVHLPCTTSASPAGRRTKRHHPAAAAFSCTRINFVWLSFIVLSAIFIIYRLSQQDRLAPHRSIG